MSRRSRSPFATRLVTAAVAVSVGGLLAPADAPRSQGSPPASPRALDGGGPAGPVALAGREPRPRIGIRIG